MDRVQNTKLVLWVITGLAAAVGVTRFVFGLGATTNLTDATPWGFWIGFDVMAGVALAGGGFVVTAIFYILRREEFHHLVRPAVLTAFLGYVAVIIGLMFDLGLPWNIWHMIIYWNPHSPLFEVGWCVMLYTTVLLLEFSPVPLEESSHYAMVRSFLMKFRFPLVLLGIMLSTLHQSSLGSLFLIMPFKLNPLWYSNVLPIQFFVSAIALGLMMVSLESLVSHWLYRRKPETHLVAKLSKAAVWVLSTYLGIKLIDMAISGELSTIFAGTWESNLFIFELLLSAIIPIVLFSIPRIRNTPAGQWIGSSMVVFGMILNRIDVGGLTMLGITGDSYFPSWMELSISLGVVSVAALAFLYAIEKFHIWEVRPKHPESDPHAEPIFGHTSEVWLGAPAVAARTKYSLALILSFAIGFALIPQHRTQGEGVVQVTAQKARGGTTLFIDGNRNGYGALFDHAGHADSLKPEVSCATCHHMNLPQDRESGCWECHKSMYSETRAFNHDWHGSPAGGNIACSVCHDVSADREATSAKKCKDCHIDLEPDGSSILVEDYVAGSYADVMHQQCLGCHKKKSTEIADKPDLALCPTCHRTSPPPHMKSDVGMGLAGEYSGSVVLPAPASESVEK
ncbi:MAG: NrfD/PsrC family molybdoenzyme membrane anchor subunit [Candidatus Zixiibacteriota bacterium]